MTGSVHFSSERGDWSTPCEFVRSCARLYGQTHFTFDAAANRDNAKAFVFATTEGVYTDEVQLVDPADGLSCNWGRHAGTGVTWINPPYGRGIGAWIDKMVTEAKRGTRIVALLPARPDTIWFQEGVLKNANDTWFVKGRLHFDGHENAAPFPSCIAAFNINPPLQRLVYPRVMGCRMQEAA